MGLRAFLVWLRGYPLDNQNILQLQAIHPVQVLRENHKTNTFCHQSKESLFFFPHDVKAFLLLTIKHLPGKNRWVVAVSFCERGENTPPLYTIFLAQTVLISWLEVWASPFWMRALSFNLPTYWVVRTQIVNSYKGRNQQIEWRSWEGEWKNGGVKINSRLCSVKVWWLV